MFDSDFYNLSQELQGDLFQAGIALQKEPLSPLHPLLQIRRGFAESPGWMLVQAAEFDPEPLSVSNVRVRAVWSSERIIRALLDLMAGEKWLNRAGEEYALTDAGRAMLQNTVERRVKLLSPLADCLPRESLTHLEILMHRVIEASLSSPQPLAKWSLLHSRHRAPPEDAPVPVKIFQYCADFNAYRDDSHMAAFASQQIEAYIWEAFSFIWRGEAHTADGLFDQLIHRGYAHENYLYALNELVNRGWIEASGDAYQLTQTGRTCRDEAERLTDAYYYAPWPSLAKNGEAEELRRLMLEIRERCQAIGQ
jgi:DNA-binding PadR family transcriptional regulator